MSEQALPCIVCDKPLRNVFPENVPNQPYDAVACSTAGNYGSTVWDSFTGHHLEFNVCDDCLLRAADKDQVMVGRLQKPVTKDDGILWVPVDEPLVLWHPNEWEPSDE